MNFQEIYRELKEEFKSAIIDNNEIKERLFTPEYEGKARLSLTSTHIKPLPHTEGAQPEAITTKYIKKLLRKIGIEEDLIVPQVRIKASHFSGRVFNRYPDFGILNPEEGEGKSLLFEIESLNKELSVLGDGEGIEQADEWFHVCVGLEQEYNAIITNFNEWYFLIYDKTSNMMKEIQKTPLEILEIIRNVAIGRERVYQEEDQGEEVSKEFYAEFAGKLQKLLDPDDSSILISGLNIPAGASDKEFNQKKITYYRTIFSRMLFVKILLDWKLLEFDPIQEIFDEENERNYFNNLKDLFFKVFNNDKERIDVLERFQELPYLNGGLFRYSEIEEKNLDVSLNSQAIVDIWQFLKRYNFTLSETKEEEESSNGDTANNAINPNILGYIFEKTIGDYRKATGAYYTRSKITNYITKNTIEKYLIDKINKKFKHRLPWLLDSIIQFKMYKLEIKTEIFEFLIVLFKELKICDPAVGSGAFLVSAGNFLVRLYRFLIKTMGLEDLPYKSDEVIEGDRRPFKDLYDLKTWIVQNNLFGVDINSSAVEICELRLWLWIAQPPKGLDTIDIRIDPLPNIEYNIRVGNSLIGYTKGIKEIRALDKKTGVEHKFIALSEWVGKKRESLTQMLLERNTKIKSYYEETDRDKRELLRAEIKDLTEEYNVNFDNLLLDKYRDLNIVGQVIPFNPDDISESSFENVDSILIRANSEFQLTDEEKNEIRTDETRQQIRGITFGKKQIRISRRVFYPQENDRFNAINPYDIYQEIFNHIDINDIKEVEIRYFINKEDLIKIKRFHWSMEFSDFFTKSGFDIIIANPPYGNIFDSITKKVLNLSDKITEDAYINFLYKLLRKDIPFQYAGILTPKSYLLRQKYLDIRNNLLKNIGIYEITDIGSGQFPGATNEVQIIFFHKNENYPDKIKIRDLFDNETRIEYDLNEAVADPIRIDQLYMCRNQVCEYIDRISGFYYYSLENNCPACKHQTIQLNRIRIKPSEEIFDLINKIERKGDLNYLNTVDFPKMIRGEEDEGLKKVKKILEDNLNKSCIFIDAKEDMNYYYFDKNKSFSIEQIPDKFLKGDMYEYYINPKLLIKHNNIIPETLYTEDNVCFTSSIYSLLHDDINELKFLSVIINSSLIQFYCIYGINNQKDTTINLNQYMIRHLPLIKPNEEIIVELSGYVDRISQDLRNNDGQPNEDVYNLLRDIDDIIFNLYELNEDEKKIIKTSCASFIDYFNSVYGKN